MVHVVFSHDFDWHPDDRSTVAYKASDISQSVKRECAELAILGGFATEVPTPPTTTNEAENGDNAPKARRTAGKSPV